MSEDARNKIIELVEKKYGPLIRKVAYMITDDFQLTEDVQQEVMWKFLNGEKDKFELPPDQMKSYICAAVRNTAINMVKKNNRINMTSFEELLNKEFLMDNVEIRPFEDKYGFGLGIQELLEHLDSLDRDIICLKYGMGYNKKEISLALGMTEETVRKREYRAKIKLQNILIERGEF